MYWYKKRQPARYAILEILLWFYTKLQGLPKVIVLLSQRRSVLLKYIAGCYRPYIDSSPLVSNAYFNLSPTHSLTQSFTHSVSQVVKGNLVLFNNVSRAF